MNARERLVRRTMDLQREIVRARLSRRDLLKMGLLGAGSGMLLPIPGLSLRAARAHDACPLPGVEVISPPTRPWVEELPRLVEKRTVPNNDPANIGSGNGGGAPAPNPVGTLSGGDSKIRLLSEHPELAGATPYATLGHQAWGKGGATGNFPPVRWYELRAKEFRHVWHRDLPAGSAGQRAWGFDGVFPGPMLRMRYGEPQFVRIHNDLPGESLGFGINQISTHMHNLHAPAESDGNPLFTNYPGHYWDYHYPNVYAGVNQYGGIGNPDEALGSMWYHDHKLDFTAQNVYAGLAGMACIYDAWGAYPDPGMGDYGDETRGWRLPCGENFEYDVGLVFHDRQFDPEGRDFFPLACFDGAIGDKMTVNGRIQPFMRVKQRKYRFRMLNMGPSRFFEWFLSDGKPFTVIATDGNLLPAPVTLKSFKQSPAERFDIVVDFSQYKPGTEILLVNRAEQTSGRGPTGRLLARGVEVLKWIVTSESFGRDESRVPGRLRPLPDIRQPVSRRREWKFDRKGGEWTVNNEIFDRRAVRAEIREGSAERWTVFNAGGSWAHPVHMHFEEHQRVRDNGRRPAALEAGRKDTIRLDANASAEFYMRFRDFKGIYPMHCHNVVHEDHSMMVMFKVV